MTERSASTARPRSASIDILRGVLATMVVCYHYSHWSGLVVPSWIEVLLIKFSIYAVEAFFVVSGFSLYYVYQDRDFAAPGAWRTFYRRRLERIGPLFYFAVGLVILLKLIAVHVLDDPGVKPLALTRVLLNLTLAFGVVDPSQAMPVGGWSLGIEAVFYALLPLLIGVGRWRGGLPGLLIGSVFVAWWWESYQLSPTQPLAEQGASWAAFLNHFHLFVAGMCLGRLGTARLARSRFWCGLAMLVIAFCWPIADDDIGLATGVQRWLLSAVVVAAVGLLSRYDFAESRLKSALLHLGKISYSVYLMHFFGYLAISRLLPQLGAGVIPVAVLATLVVSELTYAGLERPYLGGARRTTGTTQRVRFAGVVGSEPTP